jgi:transcriptional regulator with XRE-family HTH domain
MKETERRALRKRTFGEWFRMMREAKGLTQTEIAEVFGWTTGQFPSNWERGCSLPPTHIYLDLARVLGIPPRSLVEAVYEARKAELAEEEKKALHQIKAHMRRAG